MMYTFCKPDLYVVKEVLILGEKPLLGIPKYILLAIINRKWLPDTLP